jgi:methyl-accepting chemotaxis protein
MTLANLHLRTRLIAVFGSVVFFLAMMTIIVASETEGPASVVILVSGLIGIAVTMGAGWWTATSVTGPLTDAVKAAKRISSGDLTVPVQVKGSGEIRELTQALQQLNERLFKVVSEVRTGTTTVATTSSQISRDNAALSTRTEAQAGSLEETASSIEELTSTVKQNADNAQQAHQLVTSASDLAIRGGTVVGQVVKTMGSIKDSSSKIVDIIGVIDGIAFQTNILALNAAVEAARAGEQGRGFAVVASEVRTLAQRSASAAKEIKALINDSVAKVDAGSHLVDDAGRTMNEIVESVKYITGIIKNISSASLEQSAGIELVNGAITHIDRMTQKNAMLVEDATKTATGLNQQAVALLQAVFGFQLGDREYGNEEEAIALVKAGVAMMQEQGREALVAEINKLGKGKFLNRDLYLSAYDVNVYRTVAHGSNPRVVGLNAEQAKDSDGRNFIKEMIEIARSKGSGWLEYKWAHPITNADTVKNAYFEKCGDLVITCGAYKR